MVSVPRSASQERLVRWLILCKRPGSVQGRASHAAASMRQACMSQKRQGSGNHSDAGRVCSSPLVDVTAHCYRRYELCHYIDCSRSSGVKRCSRPRAQCCELRPGRGASWIAMKLQCQRGGRCHEAREPAGCVPTQARHPTC